MKVSCQSQFGRCRRVSCWGRWGWRTGRTDTVQGEQTGHRRLVDGGASLSSEGSLPCATKGARKEMWESRSASREKVEIKTSEAARTPHSELAESPTRPSLPAHRPRPDTLIRPATHGGVGLSVGERGDDSGLCEHGRGEKGEQGGRGEDGRERHRGGLGGEV